MPSTRTTSEQRDVLVERFEDVVSATWHDEEGWRIEFTDGFKAALGAGINNLWAAITITHTQQHGVEYARSQLEHVVSLFQRDEEEQQKI